MTYADQTRIMGFCWAMMYGVVCKTVIIRRLPPRLVLLFHARAAGNVITSSYHN